MSNKINKHVRWQIVEKFLAGLPYRTIGRHLGISKSSVSRILQHFQNYGCVENLPSILGRPRLLAANDIKYLEVLLKERVDWYLWELQSQMDLWLGQKISYTTIWRVVHRLGYSHKQVC
jgi:transposase